LRLAVHLCCLWPHLPMRSYSLVVM